MLHTPLSFFRLNGASDESNLLRFVHELNASDPISVRVPATTWATPDPENTFSGRVLTLVISTLTPRTSASWNACFPISAALLRSMRFEVPLEFSALRLSHLVNANSPTLARLSDLIVSRLGHS